MSETEVLAGSPETASANRLTVRLRRVPGMPTISARLWLRGGTRAEPSPGLALLTGRLLAEGSRRRGYAQIADDAESRGMTLASFGAHETIGVAIDALATDWRLAVDWLAELAIEPAFPAPRLDWVRRQAIAELESSLDQPAVRTVRTLLAELYGCHPYARPTQGDAVGLASASVEDCRTFHHRTLGWGGCLVVAGDLDEAAVDARVGSLFGSLSGVSRPLPPVPSLPPRVGMRRRVALPESEQAHLFVGQLTVPRDHADLPALELAAVALGAGAGLAGRLPERVRERDGLAYGVDVAVASGAGLDAGRLTVYAGVARDAAERAERAVRDELERVLDDGFAEEEIDDARAYLLGRDPFRRETARQWADLLAEAELYGVPVDRPEWVRERLDGLGRADVETALRRWLDPETLCVVVGTSQPG